MAAIFQIYEPIVLAKELPQVIVKCIFEEKTSKNCDC